MSILSLFVLAFYSKMWFRQISENKYRVTVPSSRISIYGNSLIVQNIRHFYGKIEKPSVSLIEKYGPAAEMR